MSWHFSQALVAGYLEENCSDGKPSVPLKSTSTADVSSCSDKMTGSSSLSQSGMMSLPLKVRHGEDLLMWFRADSLARISASTEKEKGLPESDPDCGPRWQESFARYNQSLRSWKIHQLLLFEDLELSSVIWPKWGSMRNGAAYRQPTLVRRTEENESGSLPTPRCHDAKKMYLAEMKRNSPCLAALVMFDGQPDCGVINPAYSEHVMGWIIGWTDLKPLEMDKFLQWRKQHGIYSGVDHE